MSNPNRDLNCLYPLFRDKVEKIMRTWSEWCKVHHVGYRAYLAEGFRTTERQQELYAQGRTKDGEIVTQKNGTTNPSNHQSGLAADIVLAKNGVPTWDLPQLAWDYLGHLARAEGLTYGGDWKTFKDVDHVEWPRDESNTYQRAAEWKKAKALK